MKCKAAVAWAPNKPLQIEDIEVEGPREGEVLLKVVASGVCHTDAFTLSGEDPEGAFPCVLGHEGGCEVVECGPGVKTLKPGDHVITTSMEHNAVMRPLRELSAQLSLTIDIVPADDAGRITPAALGQAVRPAR